MFRHVTIFLLVAVILDFGLAASAQDSGEAAQAYVAGDQAWNAGKVDEAITQWTQALKLKPNSSLTKDRLIEALKRKVDDLTKQLAQAQSGKSNEIVIRSVGNPQPPTDSTLLPPDKYTPDAVNAMLHQKITAAQHEAIWNGLKGYRVQWQGTIKDIKQSGVGGFDATLQCGPCIVKATLKLTDSQALSLNVGRRVTIVGALDDATGSNYRLSAAQIM